MEGGRSSVVLLFLALALAAGSLAAVAQLPPPADQRQRYVLIALRASDEIQMRATLRTVDDVALPGFANRTNHWFAVTGSESLIQQAYSYGRRNIAGKGMGNLLRVPVNNNGTQQ